MFWIETVPSGPFNATGRSGTIAAVVLLAIDLTLVPARHRTRKPTPSNLGIFYPLEPLDQSVAVRVRSDRVTQLDLLAPLKVDQERPDEIVRRTCLGRILTVRAAIGNQRDGVAELFRIQDGR